MQEVSYKIYNASAGSGKTYTLVREYLKIILSSNKNWAYQQILAITFTNKAVNEMKQRILESLFAFSKVSDFEQAQPLFKDLCLELKITPSELKIKSNSLLKEILHNYAFFDISTIDKFTHRLIRTFAKDLKLPQNFEVILDTDLLLGEAVNRLLSKAGEDLQLTEVLIDFTLEKIDEDKTWDISFDLNKIGKLLFDENHATQINKLKDKTLDDFSIFKKKIKSQIKEIQSANIDIATATLNTIQENGLEIEDFTRKTLPNHFLKITQGVSNFKTLYGNKLEENLSEGKVYNKSLDEAKKTTIDHIQPQLLETFLKIKEANGKLALLLNSYANIVPLTVLNAINKEIRDIEEEKNQIHISAFNSIISKEIKNQPAPFIYERLGEKYRHYFIDEFQDTSQMQWENLIPLIASALEGENIKGEKGSLFLVGDAKQAIYRWRGGKAEQFLNLINIKTNPFVIDPNTKNLPVNYRSHEEIINFNNNFFSHISSHLNNVVFGSLFFDGNKQGVNTKKNGFVQLTFLENNKDENEEEQYCKEVLETVNAILKRNYSHKDICILVRENRKGILLADFLIQNNIPIISTDSLLLKNNEEVSFLINLLQYCVQPEDLNIAYQITYYLAKKNIETHSFIQQHLKELTNLLLNTYGIDIKFIRETSVYDGLEYVIKKMAIAKNSSAHITYLLDAVLNVEQKEGTGIPNFLSYWEKKSDSLSIPAPENSNAVQIMSIHKSKGLQFPIVIFPFANSNIHPPGKEKLWLPITIEDGFTHVLLNKKQDMEHYSPLAGEIYNDEQNKLELDAYNVLYVALTRAVKELYIISKKEVSPKGDHKLNLYSGLFIDYLINIGQWQPNEYTYTFGELDTNLSQEENNNVEQNITYQYSHKDRPSFNIITKTGMLWGTNRETALNKGNTVHHIMAMIESNEDITDTFNTLLKNGEINDYDTEYLKRKILQIVAHPGISKYYQSDIKVYNEKDILTTKGKVIRPDRIVFNDNKVTIIDYKTGLKNTKYKEQLYEYADALQLMGFEIENKIIIYINDNIIIDYV